MDVFHLTKEEIKQLDAGEFNHMVQYAWLKFSVMRADLPWRSKKKGKEGIDYVTDGIYDQSRYSKVHT